MRYLLLICFAVLASCGYPPVYPVKPHPTLHPVVERPVTSTELPDALMIEAKKQDRARPVVAMPPVAPVAPVAPSVNEIPLTCQNLVGEVTTETSDEVLKQIINDKMICINDDLRKSK